MSDFLQNLVLRAAGLPMIATPEPRALPAAEPLELAGEDETVPAEEPIPAAPVRPERERQPEAPPGRPVVIEPEKAGVPEDVIKQFGVVREPIAIAEEGGDVPVLPPQPVTPREERPAETIVEREIVRERVVEAAGETQEAPPALVQPAVAPIAVPRETIVERETIAGEPAALAAPEAAPPVVLQPIVVEQTRTVVEPVREERTIVETRVEHAAAPEEVPVDAPEAVEEAAPRVVMQPRGDATAPAQREERDVPVALAPPTPANQREVMEHEPAPPHTLVLPQPPIPQAQQQSATEGAQQPEIDIRIGTIEIRGAVPPPPAPPPAPSVNIIRAPEPPSNFDAYTSLRNYHFPDVW
jgi:nicotinate-nucleotide--dimethylbenzimidazole phosphoribosyltransferase